MSNSLRSTFCRAVLFVAASSLISSAFAQTDLYWDTNGSTGGIGGTGNWTTTGANWTTDTNGTSALVSGGWTNGAAWSNSLANNAILQGTTGTVSLSSSTIYANQIQANTTGFTIQNSSTGTTSANRYFRTKNGIILADGVNLNVSSGVTTNGAITGLEGKIMGSNGTNGVSANSSITIVGATANADSSVRIGLDTSATDIYVPLYVNTTGNGYANIAVSSSSVTSSIYGSIIVSNNSRLVLGGNNSSTSRRINVRGNLTTTNTDLTIGEVGGGTTVVLYGSNSIGGNVVLQSGSLGYGTNTAFGSSTVVISNGTSLGQQGNIGATDQDRTLPNNISLRGNVTFGLGSFGNFFSGNIDLNNAARTVSIGNSTYISGSLTNGSLVVSNTSITRTLGLTGSNNLTALSWSNGFVAFDPALQKIGNFTMAGAPTSFTTNYTTNSTPSTNNGVVSTNFTTNATTNTFFAFPTLLVLNPAANNSISTGGALVISGTNNTISFTNDSLAPGTYTLLQGTSLNTNSLSVGGLALNVIVPTGTTNPASFRVALNAAPATYQRYVYAFSNTPTALLVTVLSNTASDLSWATETNAAWNTNAGNQPWISGESPSSFTTGDNATINAGGTLNVDPNGVSAGYVTISGSSNSVIQGGPLTALAITKDGTGTGTLSSAATLSQGLTVSNGVLSVSGALTYTNETVIAGGVLETLGNERIPDSSIVRISADGAMLRLGGNETVRGVEGVSGSVVDLPVGRTLTLNSAGSSVGFTNYANIIGGGSLVKIGTNQISFRGNNDLDSLTVSSGRADLRGNNTINSINVSAGALLGYGSTNRALGNAVVTLESGASIGQIIGMGTTDEDRTIANALMINGDIKLGIGTYGCYFSGNADLRGSSRALTLVNSTYFYGAMTNGDLVVDISNTATNSKTLYLWGANQFSNGVTLRPTFTSYPLILSIGDGSSLGGGSLSLVGRATVTVSNSLTLTNLVILSSEAVMTMDTGTRTWTQNGAISGSGSLTKAGNGTLVLAAANSHVGTNSVSAGTLVLGNAAALGASNNALSLGGGTVTLSQSSGDVLAGNTTVSADSILDLGNGTPSRTIRLAGLGFASTSNILTVSNTANGSVYLPTTFDTNTLVQIKSAETTNAAALDPTTGLLSFSGGITPPSGLSYTPSLQSGTVGTAITAMNPSVTGTVTNYSVSPALPTGLSIDAGTGVISGTPTAATASASYTVTAANAGGSTTADVTISVGKATPSISVPPTASSIVQGQSLASSTLSGGTASVAGTFAWTDPSYVPATAGIWGESVTFTPTDTANYNTNTTTVSVTVVSQYNNWLQGQTNNSTNQLAYAIGGASSPTATNGVASTTTVTSNALSITAIVRTNDPSLAVYGQSITNLSVGTWVTNDVIMSVSTNQTGATPGTTQRQTFTTSRTNTDTKKFLRLNTTLGQ